MMLLRDYLADNTLITNTHNIFDYNLFRQRLLVRFGNRAIREDIPAEYISIYAQNTIDINVDYFKFLLSDVINPFATWAETETHGDSGESTKTETTTGGKKTEHSGTITTADSGTVNNTIDNTVTDKNTSQTVNPTTSKTTNNVNAYNSLESVPHDSTDVSSTNNSDTEFNGSTTTAGTSAETRNLTNTQTFANSDSDTTSGSNNAQNNYTNSGNYKKSGYNVNDFQRVLQMSYNAYDTIIDYVVKDILITIADMGCMYYV